MSRCVVSDNLRDQDEPEVLGYKLDPRTLLPIRESIDTTTPGDYGHDPMGNGMVKMVPSGRVVTIEEARKILAERGV